MSTATKFNKPTIIEAAYGRPLSEGQLLDYVPSLFASAAHKSRSDKYSYIQSSNVLAALQRENFLPVWACQSRTRSEDKREHTKHMVRFRQGGADVYKSEVPEIVLVNSHDGSSAYHLYAGIFRMVCCNGLIAGDTFDSIKVKHSGSAVEHVMDAASKIVEEFPRVVEQVNRFKEIQLTPDEQGVFAQSAALVRFGIEKPEESPLPTEKLLTTRRGDDEGRDLWRTLNVVQENALRGGQKTVRRKTRAVKGIDQSVVINRALWHLAEKMAELKGR